MQIKKMLTKFGWLLFLLMGFGMLAKTTLAQNCVPQPVGYGQYTVTGTDCGIPAGFLTGCGVGFYTVADGSCRAIGVPTSPPYPVVVITGTPGGGGGGGCTSNCSGLVCGDDGCGGSCGNCPSGWACNGLQCYGFTCTGGSPTGTVAITSGITSYDVYAYGVSGGTVAFQASSDPNGSDLKYYTGSNLGGGTWKGTIDLTQHIFSNSIQVVSWMNGTFGCSSFNFSRNDLPTFGSLVLKNSLGNASTWIDGNKDQICKSTFYNDSQPRNVNFVFSLIDANGGSDIKSAQIKWNNVTYDLNLGAVIGNTVAANVMIDFSGINNPAALPIYLFITDSKESTGWITLPYSFKSWGCNVSVSGNIYDGSAGQACNTTGFSVLANNSMGFDAINYKNMSGGIDVLGSIKSISSFGANNLIWNNSYLPLMNNGVVGLENGDLAASERWTRFVDLGTGTTTCGTTSQFIVGSVVSAYSTTPQLELDFSFKRNQEAWFQGRGVDIRAKTSVNSGVPITANILSQSTLLSVDNLEIGTSNNGIVSANSINNINGWGSEVYGFPNNWALNQSVVDNKKYNYQTIFDDYFVKMGEGTTGVTTIGLGTSGVNFVNGDLNIDGDIVVPLDQYLMVVVNGTINIGVGASRVDGIYVANGGIKASGDSNNQLVINGILYAANNSNLELNRSFTDKIINNTIPATVINYRPDMIFVLPGRLNKILSGWREL